MPSPLLMLRRRLVATIAEPAKPAPSRRQRAGVTPSSHAQLSYARHPTGPIVRLRTEPRESEPDRHWGSWARQRWHVDTRRKPVDS